MFVNLKCAGENGQLALRSLASSTFSTLLPKIETHGQLGAARWRLVGAGPHRKCVSEHAWSSGAASHACLWPRGLLQQR